MVVSAGNEPESLVNPLALNRSRPLDPLPYKMVKDFNLIDHCIIVGSLSQNYERSVHSSYPSWDRKLQMNTIHTLGENIPSKGGLLSGTSFAAPIISGCILLIKQKVPSLSIFEIKESILNSASKNFFIDMPRKKGRYQAIWVYDPA